MDLLFHASGVKLPTDDHVPAPLCRHRATRLCIEAVQSLMRACNGDLQFEGPGWNSCTVDLIRLAKAHSVLVLHQTFVDSVAQLQSKVGFRFVYWCNRLTNERHSGLHREQGST